MVGNWGITSDASRNLVSWRLTGYFALEDVEAFHEASIKSVKELGANRGEHLGLSDIRDMVIQSQDVVNRFGLVLSDPDVKPLRHAVIVPQTLVRSQFLRVAPAGEVELFTHLRRRWRGCFRPSERLTSRTRQGSNIKDYE